MDIYRTELIELSKNPPNWGKFPKPDLKFSATNPLCGDRVDLSIKLKGKVIKDIKFSGAGCVISKAATSRLIDAIRGKSITQIMKMTTQDALNLVGGKIAAGRVQCASLALVAIRQGLRKQ